MRDDDRPPWWDDAFSSLLLGLVPPGAATLIDAGCGTGQAAEVLLQARDRLRYLGVDGDRSLLQRGAERLSQRPFTPRVTLRLGACDALPVPDGTADVVLLLSSLGREPDPRAALVEARRVLVPGGRVLAVELDAEGALGPQLPALVERAGFLHVEVEHLRTFSERVSTALVVAIGTRPEVP